MKQSSINSQFSLHAVSHQFIMCSSRNCFLGGSVARNKIKQTINSDSNQVEMSTKISSYIRSEQKILLMTNFKET
jgi:hypothetical protein